MDVCWVYVFLVALNVFGFVCCLLFDFWFLGFVAYWLLVGLIVDCWGFVGLFDCVGLVIMVCCLLDFFWCG